MTEQPLLARVQARLASGREPYRTLYQRVVDAATREERNESEKADYENCAFNANTAKSLAFLHWLKRDPIPARRAAQLMAKMKTEIPKGLLLQIATGTQDILQMSEALTAYAQAYHFLAQAGYPTPAPATNNLTKLTEEIAKLVKAILNYGQGLTKTFGVVTRHNYLLKGSSAVGLAGFYLNRADWVALGQQGVSAVRDAQGPNLDRGWGEGSDYFAYAAVNFLPFFIALNRQICAHGPNFDGIALENYLADPIWQTVFVWYLKTRLPSGERPGVDDARYKPFFSGLLATDPLLPEHATDHYAIPASFWAWDWRCADLRLTQQESLRFHSVDMVNLSADMLINFDDHIPRIEPTGEGFEPTQISRICGQAVLRSGWGRDALYLLLQGEEKKMARAGGRHEHNDGASFILCAYGELLALDPGYLGWSRREHTNRPEHHNRILIANHEPEPTAVLDHFFELPNLTGAQSGTWFSAHNGRRPRHERNVLFVNQRFFVLDDAVQDAGANEITFYLHGHGEFARHEPGTLQNRSPVATWQRPQARLRVYQTTSLGEPQLAQRRNAHGLAYLAPQMPAPEHEVLQATQRGDRLRFLTILYPQPAGSKPTLAVQAFDLVRSHAFHLTEREDNGKAYHTFMLTRTEGATHERLATPWGELRCNGNFVLLAGEERLQLIYCDHASEIILDGQVYLKASHPFHGALEWDGINEVIYGWQISAATANRLQIFTSTEPVLLAGLKKLGFDKSPGLLHAEIEAATRDFTIRTSAHPFRAQRLTSAAGIHPWQPYGDGEDYLHDGAGMLVQRGQGTGRTFGYQRHGLEILPNTCYRLRCRVKTELHNGFVAAGLGEWSGRSETHHDFGFLGGEQDWQEISGEWLSPAAGKTMAVMLYGSENFQGRAWFKDAMLEEVRS